MIPGYNGTGADFDDVPLLVAEAIHNADPCAGSWSAVSPENKKSKVSRAKTRLNNEVAKQMTPALLTLVDSTDELRQYLRAVGLALEK